MKMAQDVINMPHVKQYKLSVKRILHFMSQMTLESGTIFTVQLAEDVYILFLFSVYILFKKRFKDVQFVLYVLMKSIFKLTMFAKLCTIERKILSLSSLSIIGLNGKVNLFLKENLI
jgi:hypothetical protein